MAGCRQACVCSELAEPSLISPCCLAEASLHATVLPNINEWKQGIASVSEGRDGSNSQLLSLSSFLFLYITRFKAQTIPYDKCLIADSYLSVSPPHFRSHTISQKGFSIYPKVTPACGQSSSRWPAPVAMYSQFTVTRTCLTSAEATSLAALHSYLPDCSRVIPRISRYSSSPSNSLPGGTEKYRWWLC